MSDIRLIWCHGSLSQPWGSKSQSLANIATTAGLTMEGIDFQDLDNPDERVDKLVGILSESEAPAILCGSSMGGYVAAAAARHTTPLGLFLLAPAFYLQGYDIHVFSGLPKTITVVHGWQDDVVPVDNSIRFAKQHQAELHILPDGHRLSESMDTLGTLFSHFLDRIPTT
jgi:pimeloyl-ACP methyl ester carboxylesterase